MTSARCLGASALYPLCTLVFTLLAWQNEQLEEAALSDSDCSEDECDSDGEPAAKYATEEEYSLYVIHPILPTRIP